jgi:hypothetical protein
MRCGPEDARLGMVTVVKKLPRTDVTVLVSVGPVTEFHCRSTVSWDPKPEPAAAIVAPADTRCGESARCAMGVGVAVTAAGVGVGVAVTLSGVGVGVGPTTSMGPLGGADTV